MSFGFLQQLMLIGFAGVALPIIAHLLSKRKFDVVFWGAMQFLELGRRTRRRIRLEELLLLLLRIGVISLLALAFARPWGKGGPFTWMTEAVRRDIVLIVDGSYSMGWVGGNETPHAAARQLAHRVLGDLHAADTVSLIDAREQVRGVIEDPTTDLRQVREGLDQLSPPAGSSRLPAALTRAVQLLGKTTNPVKEVILLTDGQAIPWSTEDVALWARFDDLCTQQTIRPRIWAFDLMGPGQGIRNNFSIDRIQLSRTTTVPDFPVRIRTTVRQSGGTTTRRSVYFSVNGQRLNDRTTVVSLPPQGEAPVEFEHRFPAEGAYLATISLDDDELPGDNAAHAAIVVAPAAPVLLVDGKRHLDPVRGKSFFVRAALTSSGNATPWVRSTVIEPNELTAQSLSKVDVVALLDVSELSPNALQQLSDFVKRGGGLIAAPGSNAKPEFYNGPFFSQGRGLSPAELGSDEGEAKVSEEPVLLDGDSLETPWLSRFKPGAGVDLSGTRFSHWWNLKPAAPDAARESALGAEQSSAVGAAVTVARLKNGLPWIVTRRFGDGQVAMLAAPLDTEWSTLPSKNDFVPLLHELIFSMVSRNSGRNVEVGMPLEFPLPDNVPIQSLQFLTPDEQTLPAQRGGDDHRPLVRLDATFTPGVYRAVRKSRPQESPEFFVVEFDRREADLTPLTDATRTALAEKHQIHFLRAVEDLKAAAAADAPRSEVWWLLLLAVLGLLVFEVVMTRRLIRGGHELLDSPSADEAPRQPVAPAA